MRGEPFMSKLQWPQPSLRLAGFLALGLLLASNAAVAETVPSAPPPADTHAETRTVVSTGTTVTDEPIRYPAGASAQITAVEITLQPGQQTGWHTHPVPLFGYILEGELTVDYGAKGERTYRKGDGFVEAMNQAHDGRNTGRDPVKILAVFIGTEGVAGSVPVSPPARQR
jgi:quercetin dioxygenase-like cupin family protein